MSSVEKEPHWGGMNGSRRMRPAAPTGARLHRIAEVMEQENVSARAVALRMNVPQSQAAAESQPTSDLLLTALYRWQAALNVPLSEILGETDDRLSPQIRFRSSLLKAMRTVRSIQERADSEAVQRLGLQLAQQLLALMPELEHVGSWPTFGQRRRPDEPGAIWEKQIPADFFHDDSRGDG
jgi:transcriptional regulator with XRE-family HTH domain